MSDYTEHLISMAGGDGDPDLDAIQARRVDYTDGCTRHDDCLRADMAALLAVVRSQQAKIERVRELHESSFSDQWGRTSEVPTEFGGWCKACGNFRGRCCPTIAALTATEDPA